MTVGELIEMLEDMAEQSEHGDMTEVRLASQPSQPFEYSVRDVVLAIDSKGDDVIFVAEGQQLDYLCSGAREVLDWQKSSKSYAIMTLQIAILVLCTKEVLGTLRSFLKWSSSYKGGNARMGLCPFFFY